MRRSMELANLAPPKPQPADASGLFFILGTRIGADPFIQMEAPMKYAILIVSALVLSTTAIQAQSGKGLPNDPRPAATASQQNRDTSGMAPNKSGSGTSTSGGKDANDDQGRDAMPDSNQLVKPLQQQNKPRQ
jgi:hypothetical protein